MSGDRPEQKQYESPINRARALYRIPTAPNSNRTLELFCSRPPLLEGFEWPGSLAVSCRLVNKWDPSSEKFTSTEVARLLSVSSLAPLPFPANAFDLVMLHRTLDELAESACEAMQEFDAAGLLNRIRTVLVPGGVIAGCIDNRCGVKELWRRSKHLVGKAGRQVPASHYTLTTLRKLIAKGGYTDFVAFSLLPNCNEPLRLVDMDPAVSRMAFRHELQIGRQSWSKFGYAMRRAIVELGVYPYLEESYFFWARKPC